MSDFFISDSLRVWYHQNKRDLPWRETQDPYAIWISEIILQQTRVQQGLNYYTRFMSRFPTVLDLANAPLQEVLTYWQGLGYYSRARNLHAAALQIKENYEGTFPDTYEQILSLKGIGEYTAAAISSFAFGLPYAVLDGNVFRVLSRLFAIDIPIDTTPGKKNFQKLANQLLPPHQAADHNQAMMELGALVCLPQNPLCGDCPLSSQCLAYEKQAVTSYPVKQGKIKVRERWFYYLIIEQGDTIFLQQRTDKDIWRHLFEFPLIECEEKIVFDDLMKTERFTHLIPLETIESIQPVLLDKKHVLSHQRIFADFYRIKVSSSWIASSDFQSLSWAELDQYPISRLTELALERL